MGNATCYACEKAAITREHAPPLCIFPEAADTPDGRNYRKDLVTVPSCEEHNLRKSKDDEYLKAVLLHGYFNHAVAQTEFETKLIRAMTRRPAMFRQLYEKLTPAAVDGNETVAVDIDRSRFDSSISSIVRALHYHEFGSILPWPVFIHSQLFLALGTPNADQQNDAVIKYSKLVIRAIADCRCDVRGSNPQIFWYQLFRNEGRQIVIGRFSFYGGFDVFFHSVPGKVADQAASALGLS